MKLFEFATDKPLKYVFTGKFEAPSLDWVHDCADLIDYELFVITRGVLYISYQKEYFTVRKGEVLLLPPGVPPDNMRNGFRASDCSFYWLHFFADHPIRLHQAEETLEGAEESPAPDSRPLMIPQQSSAMNTDKMVVLMKQLQDAVRSEYDTVALDYMTTLILCEIHNQYRIHRKTAPAKKSQQQLIHDILDYVKQHIGENITVSSIARHFGYNEKYLSHRFRLLFGISLKRHIMKQKIDEANFMLTDTNMTILEISTALGFADSHNFMKFYKRLTELTPSEYRNAFAKRMLFHK